MVLLRILQIYNKECKNTSKISFAPTSFTTTTLIVKPQVMSKK